MTPWNRTFGCLGRSEPVLAPMEVVTLGALDKGLSSEAEIGDGRDG